MPAAIPITVKVFCEVLGLLFYCPSAPYPNKKLARGMYLHMFKINYYSKGYLQEKGSFVIDLEGSQIQHIQRNNAPQV
jgi:hypothetical protein